MLRRIAFVIVAVALAVAGGLVARSQAPAAAAPAVPAGFEITPIAHVPQARELFVAANGDLIAGTLGGDVYIVPHADATPGTPHVFAHVGDEPAAGVAYADGELYIGTQFGVWRVPYTAGDQKARRSPEQIAKVRTSGTSGAHTTTSVALSHGTLYIGVGSSCNICDPEVDATRATVQQAHPDGSGMQPKAIHIRNPIALAVDGTTGAVWAGVAGQDELPHGHPYEIFDPVTVHAGVVDYGWPHCYENHRPATPGQDCAHQTPPRVAFPAYETPIGAAIYPLEQHGKYAFPASYRGGAFVALHGSWHAPPVPPRVAFVPLKGNEPATAVDWNDPNAQWKEFMGGYQTRRGERTGRPTGIAVGPDGSLFVGDDDASTIYRIRPVQQ
jgi:glucose/arabinose dehydrogenase